MAKTNFSGPITTGPIQVNTGTTIGTNVRDAAWVTNNATFPVTYASFAVTTDANRLAVTGSNGAATTSVTLVDSTQNVPGITSVGGFEMASAITLTSSGDDSALTATITGTDVFGNSQTEGLTMANAGVATSTKSFKTVTAIDISGAGTVGTLEVGILEAAQVTVPCRSLFNETPLGQTSSTTNKNLANNIVIPPFSRITNLFFMTTTAFDTAGLDMQIGANVAQAAGATLNSFDQDYFAGDTANETQAVGNWHIPAYFDQSQAQATNCLNVSDDDASGYEVDKAVAITVNSDDALTAGQGYLYIEWSQKVNNTN
jgi:hypothetical protein